MELEHLIGSQCRRDWERTDPAAASTVRVAAIGLGWFTRGRALPALADSDRCEPTVLVSGSTEKAERVAAEFDAVERTLTYEEYADGVATEAYDAVYVCTPNAFHLDHSEAAAEHGKHVLCEKPIERDSARAADLVDACDDAGVELMIAYRMHTEPTIRRARELIDGGYVGEPMAVRGDMSQRLLERVNPDPDQWRLDEELAGGGALFDIGLYPLNTARFLLDADPVAVTGSTGSTHDAFDDVEETVACSMRFPGGVTAACFASHNARQASSITVTGTEGQVRIEPAFFQDQDRRLELSRGDSRAEIEVERVDQMREEFDYFADRLRSDADIYPDGQHGVVDVEIMEAIYEAADRDAWVDV
ncbi:MAG: D-xylose 1-dehydrogenase Gfo6 [Haloferacaceae archaeon]